MLGWPEDDAGMRSACGCQHEEITIAGHENSSLRQSMRKLPEIRSPAKPLVGRCRHIDASLPQSDGDGQGNVFVEVVSDFHPRTLSAAVAPFASEQAWA